MCPSDAFILGLTRVPATPSRFQNVQNRDLSVHGWGAKTLGNAVFIYACIMHPLCRHMFPRPSLIWYSRCSRSSPEEELRPDVLNMFCQKSWYFRKIWFGQVAPLIQDQSLDDAAARNSEQWTFLKKDPHKSSHVDVIHHCSWACGVIPLMWIGFQESLSRFLRWWSPRKFTTKPVSPSCRPNWSTVQRVQRQIRWRRLCRRRSGAQTEENLLRFCDILWSLVQHVRGDVRRCKMKYVKCGYTRYKPHRILINSPCAYQSAAWKESKPLELPKCINGTLQLESGIYKAPQKRGMLVGRLGVLQGLVDEWHRIRYSWTFWDFLNALGSSDAHIMSRRSIKGKRCHILIGSVVARNARLYGNRGGPPVEREPCFCMSCPKDSKSM